jgi:hypothetical protein
MAYALAGGHVQAFHNAISRRTDLVFHLHRFQDGQTLARPDSLPLFDQDSDYHTGHGAGNLCLPRFLERCPDSLTCPEKPFILNPHLVAMSLQDNIANILAALDKDFVGRCADEQ